MSREAMRMALEALELYLTMDTVEESHLLEVDIAPKAITALRAALAEPEPRNQCGETCEGEEHMNPQPKALVLADALEELDVQFSHTGLCGEAAELRRLHEVNQDLLKALNTILNICLLDNGHWAKTIEREAHEAIAKATGEKA